MTTKNIATILLMLGIVRTNSANVSLLNNFEIVATSLIALLIFKEMISYSLWFAIFMVTIASAILSFEGAGALTLNEGSLFVLGACISFLGKAYRQASGYWQSFS